MAELVADYVLKRLRDSGVHRVYGYPGDGINGFLGAFDRADGDPEFIQARHEEMAAFMAGGHAKFTDELGCCIATSGPGAIHLLNGLYDAKLDHAPVLAIVGQQKRMSLGAAYQQEVDLQVLFKDVSEFVQVCMEPAQARHLIDRAIRIALDRRGVATLIFPGDVQEEKAVESPPREHGAVFSSIGYSRPRVLPHDEDLESAARVLNEGKKVAILAGQGASGASDELTETAELLGAGVAKALLGKDVLPDDLPFVTGSIGLLGTTASYELMNGCDTLLMVGTSFPYSEFLPKEGQARCVEIDIEPSRIGLRYPVDVQLVGDAKETLASAQPEARAQAGPLVARADRDPDRRVVAGGRRPRAPGRRPDEPAARRLGALAAPARGRDHLRRFGLLHELVRARPEAALRQSRLALGDARDDGPGHAVRDRGQVRVPEPPGDRLRRRRRVPDERDERADHDQALRGPAAATARSSSASSTTRT